MQKKTLQFNHHLKLCDITLLLVKIIFIQRHFYHLWLCILGMGLLLVQSELLRFVSLGLSQPLIIIYICRFHPLPSSRLGWTVGFSCFWWEIDGFGSRESRRVNMRSRQQSRNSRVFHTTDSRSLKSRMTGVFQLGFLGNESALTFSQARTGFKTNALEESHTQNTRFAFSYV